MLYNIRAANTWINSCSRTILFRKGANWVPLTGTRYIRVNNAWVSLTCSLPQVISWSVESMGLLPTSTNTFSFELRYVHAGINVIYTAPDPVDLPQSFQSDGTTVVEVQWNNVTYNLYLDNVLLTGDGSLYNSLYRFTPTSTFTFYLSKK